MAEGPVIVMALEAPDAIKKWRDTKRRGLGKTRAMIVPFNARLRVEHLSLWCQLTSFDEAGRRPMARKIVRVEVHNLSQIVERRHAWAAWLPSNSAEKASTAHTAPGYHSIRIRRNH
jgi:hypothetical protein